MTEVHDVDPESYAHGWRKSITEAIEAAFQAEGVPLGEARGIDLDARRKNPIHEYKVKLKDPTG